MSFNDKRFCVYIHFRNDNGKHFYVGQGTIQRATFRHRKLKDWNDIVEEAGGFTVKIIEQDLTKDEALDLESFMIDWLGADLINLPYSSSTVKELDFEDLNNRFYIDEDSPTGLRYKVNVYAHDYGDVKYSIIHESGDVAGTRGSRGFAVSVKRKSIRVHRIIYLLANKNLDRHKVVDHIDGNPFNNNVANLRLVTHAENTRNRKVDKRNVSGIPGVSLRDRTVNVSVTIDNKRVFKSYSYNKYGKEEALRLAIEWRKQKLEEAAMLNYAYSDRHIGSK